MDWIDLGLKLLMGSFGLVLYALFKVKDKLGKQFQWKIFVGDNNGTINK